MKIAIDAGHNVCCSNGKHDIGASGYAQEDDLTLELSESIVSKLELLDHTTIETLPTKADSVSHCLQQRVKKANRANADIFVSLHFNALNGQAYGTEIFALSNAAGAIAQPILNNISALGYYPRGVKRGNFYVLRYTTMPAILIECCFIDNKHDMARYDAEKMANAIVKGLVGELPPTIESNSANLKVLATTFLKPSTMQSGDIDSKQLKEIKPGTYAIASVIGQEEGHYLIRLSDGSEHFIYEGHCQIE